MEILYKVLWDEYQDTEDGLVRIKLLEDEFFGIIYHYVTVEAQEAEDGSYCTLKFEYDIDSVPEGFEMESLTEEKHKLFETTLGDILVGFIEEKIDGDGKNNFAESDSK